MAEPPSSDSVSDHGMPQVQSASEVAAEQLKTVANPVRRELMAESITVRIRWFGLALGYFLANFSHMFDETREHSPFALNAILTVGAVYALIDTIRSRRGKVLLAEFRILVSLMEALFIGLLCYFDEGISSPFRFYYFLSLLVCGIRHSKAVTLATFGLHAVSFAVLAALCGIHSPREAIQVVLTLVFMGWATWAITSLAGLLKSARDRLQALNAELISNQELLEDRIARRTKELQESQALLVQQEKQAAFGLLAAGIAHEVGNPLASISSIVQLLHRKSEDDHVKERLQMVNTQLARIRITLQELIGFGRPASRQARVVDIHDAITNALSIAKYYKRWKGKKVYTEFDRGMKPVRTVYDQVVQVVLNLMLNALDATDEGASITVSTKLEKDADGVNMVAIHIADQGQGIPEEAQSQIFEPYFTTKATGTGLGLFVCRQLVQQDLGGTIELVRSDVYGTEFRITIRDLQQKTDPHMNKVQAVPEPAPSDV